jgi:hypothetical protein
VVTDNHILLNDTDEHKEDRESKNKDEYLKFAKKFRT